MIPPQAGAGVAVDAHGDLLLREPSGNVRDMSELVRDNLENYLVDPVTCEGWDDLVQSHPDYSFFHGSAWARVLQDCYGYRPLYFLARDADHPPVVFPLMEVDSLVSGRRGVGLPFTDHCWPLCSSRKDAAFLFRQMKTFGAGRGWRYLEIKGGEAPLDDALPALQFYNHSLALDEDVDGLFAAMSPSSRRAVRKAKKEGLTVEVAKDEASLRTFYDLHCLTRKRHGLPPQSFQFFQSMQRHILDKDQGMVVLVRDSSGRPVSASVFFHLGGRAIFKFGGSDHAMQAMRGNNLGMWEAIRYYAERGFEQLDFGKTSLSHEGLRRFKAGFGTTERLIQYFQYDIRRETFAAYHDLPGRWVTRSFQLMPIWLLRMVGKALYKHMA